MGSPTTAPPHHRAPSLGELHQELEQEQEAQVVSLAILYRLGSVAVMKESRCGAKNMLQW